MAGKNRDLFYKLTKYGLGVLPTPLYHNILSFIMHKRFGTKFHWLNLKSPKTFSEKIQWLKSHGPIDLKSKLADKYDVREWIKSTIGTQYLVDLLPLNKDGDLVVDSVEKIDFSLLPNSFALKLTKGSGHNIICPDKNKLDIPAIKTQLLKWIKVNNFYFSRELHYRGKSRIICEKLLEYNITDYKFFCFDGEPYYVELYIDRFGTHRKVFYDMNWKKAGFTTANDSMEGDAEKPEEFEEMFRVARTLSKGWPFIRIDLYVHKGRVYFGEMTFHPAGGYTPITPREWENKLGELIMLPNNRDIKK